MRRKKRKTLRIVCQYTLLIFITAIGIYKANDYQYRENISKNEEIVEQSSASNVNTDTAISKADGAEPFEIYSDLDELGRCGTAYANVSVDTMPTEERGSIASIKPSGWHTYRYDDLIKDRYLYNRCHLIGYQLTGENANQKNLILCTRQANLAMLPYENEIADYVRSTNHHVLYRVTPDFRDDELVARGIIMEAVSVEDDEIEFSVYIPNVQEGIIIDYATGESKRSCNKIKIFE